MCTNTEHVRKRRRQALAEREAKKEARKAEQKGAKGGDKDGDKPDELPLETMIELQRIRERNEAQSFEKMAERLAALPDSDDEEEV